MMEIEINITNTVANILPWAGGLVPATLTFQKLVKTGLEPWQAFLVAAVVEGMGFVATNTTVDFYEQARSMRTTHQDQWQSAPVLVLDGAFWLSVAVTVVYLVAVVLIVVLLDPLASLTERGVGGILSTFGVLGGVMVALRNQLGERRKMAAQQTARDFDLQQKREHQAANELARLQQAQADREREAREHAYALEVAEAQHRHELEFERQRAADARKLEKVSAAKSRIVAGDSPATIENHPEAAGTIRRWDDVSPDDYPWIAGASPADIVTRYQVSGRDPERKARAWRNYAIEKLEAAQ